MEVEKEEDFQNKSSGKLIREKNTGEFQKTKRLRSELNNNRERVQAKGAPFGELQLGESERELLGRELKLGI